MSSTDLSLLAWAVPEGVEALEDPTGRRRADCFCTLRETSFEALSLSSPPNSMFSANSARALSDGRVGSLPSL